MIDDRSSLSKSSIGGAFYTIAKSLGILLYGGVLFIIIARVFPDVEDLGLAYALVSLTLASSVIAGLGLPNAATRFMSFYYGEGREDTAKRVSLFIFLVGTVASLITSLVLFFLSSDLSYLLLHNIHFDYLIQLAAIDVFFVSLITFCNYMLYSNYHFKYVASISIINSSLRFGFALMFMLIGMGIGSIMVGFIISDIISFTLLSIFLIPTLGKSMARSEEIKSLFNYSFPLYGTLILAYFSVNIDIYLLMYLSGLYAVGVYSPAILFSTTLVVVLTAMGDAMLPYSSRIYGSLGSKSLRDITHFLSRYTFLFFFPIGFILIGSANVLITLLFGNNYDDSIIPAIILSTTVTLTALEPLFNNILMAAGKSTPTLTGNSLAIPSQVLIIFAVVPFLGALGAAIARSIAYIINFLYLSYILSKMDVLYFDRPAFLYGLAGSSMASVSVYILNNLFGTQLIIFNIIIVSFAYIMFLKYTKALKKQDLIVIMNFSPPPLRRVIMIIVRLVNR